MARRRSLNRRWSQRSGNLTELDQDSDIIDTENPAWWKNIQDATMHRPSAQTSYAETTGPILDTDSLFDSSELKDKWWDNLDRTNVQSSKRFSTRRSMNPEDAVQESLISEGDYDVRLKKRKDLLRASLKRSGDTKNLLKSSNDSDVAHSEPLPSRKRNNQSPRTSDVELLQRKIRSRHSRSLADAERGDNSMNLSSDPDIVIKAKTEAVKKQTTNVPPDVNKEILASKGLFGINSGENASIVSDSSAVRAKGKGKRLSKTGQTLRQNSQEKSSIDSFDDIIDGQLNESRGAGRLVNTSGRSSNAATRMSKSLKQSHTLPASTSVYGGEEPKKVFTSESQLRGTEQMINEEAIGNEGSQEHQEEEPRSLSIVKANSRVSKRHTRNAMIEEVNTSEWDVPETQEDSRKSIGGIKSSTMIEESMDIEKSPDAREKVGRSFSALKEKLSVLKKNMRDSTIEGAAMSYWDVPETREGPRKSTSRIKSSTMIEESFAFKENDSKSTSFVNANVKDSKRRTASTRQSMQLIQHSSLAENSRSHRSQNLETSDSKGDDKANEPPSNVFRHSSLIKETKEISIGRLSSPKTSFSRQIEELEEGSEEVKGQEKIRKVSGRLLRSITRVPVNSAYELPDKERSTSPSISLSESESLNKNNTVNTSARKPSNNKRVNSRSTREPVNRSILNERSNISRKSAATPDATLALVDFGKSTSEGDPPQAFRNSAKSRKNLFMEKEAISRKSITNTNDSDQSISEELVISEQSLNSSSLRENSRVKRKIDDSNRAASRQSLKRKVDDSNRAASRQSLKRKVKDSNRAASRQGGQSDESNSEEEAHRPDESNSEEEAHRPNESKNKEEAHRSEKLNLSLSRKSFRAEKKIEPKKSIEPTNTSHQDAEPDERNSDVDTDIAENETSERMERNLRASNRASTSRKSSTRPSVSGKRIESDESISEEELYFKSKNQSSNDKSGASGTRSARSYVSRQRIQSDESSIEEDIQLFENSNPALNKSVNKSNQLPADISRFQNATNRNKSLFSTVENMKENASRTIPSEQIPVASISTTLQQNRSSVLSKSNTIRTQKNITDFFPSKFLQKSNSSKTLDTSFDKEKLDLLRKQLEMKRQRIKAMMIEKIAKKKEISVGRRLENAPNVKKLHPKQKASKEAAKPPKVVDKAYIVNGQIYKRPKLPRPKPWVTDRLYRHLWKRLEPKYDLNTRIKSERFVLQLSEVVALTIRRKKYDSYKTEVDALMNEMARIGIIKTRNDFYDFCYEYLPYDFRVKVTPMLLPGSIRIVPYDPATLHTPIIPES